MSFAEVTDEQLAHQMLQAERDLVTARFLHSQDRLQNTAVLGELRKGIARMRTEARRRELEQGLGKGGLLAAHATTFAPSGSEDSAGAGGFFTGLVDGDAAAE